MPSLRRRQPAPPAAATRDHPPGAVRLGIDSLTRRPFDIPLPRGVAQHVTLLGLTGTGKTTTAERLAEGTAASGFAVLIVDAKGASLHQAARRLAETRGLEYQELVPGSPVTLGYNPCAIGSRSQVADKLVSAFTHGPSGQVYRVIAAETLSVLVGVLRSLDEPVTIRRLRRELDRTRMPGLAHRARDVAPDLAADLADLAKRRGVTLEAFEGMRARLGALLHGEYGAILDGDGTQIDLAGALSAARVTYLSLPALAVSQDTALMARVLIQDLKQAAFERLQQPDPAPALLILDEFAALDDPTQINDLLRQAREARVGAVVSTQQLPDSRTASSLRGALLGAGLLITHRVGAGDAEAVAQAIGSVRGVRVSRSFEGGKEAGRRSVQTVDRPLVDPNLLKRLRTGEAVVLSAAADDRRIATVMVLSPELQDAR
ncbi:MAG: type IV secretion system DNA-binding domain-containing protein [Candidatus Dormiibacterota bacterium]